ncbi:DUF1611 domain-containing protein [Eilatimonas milleporae]|uniref:Putative NAD-dependent epimerase/dehydratase family protein n=1 Tax=Eilatimonas milleporae TaxID=911205 RepID=A0A3M0CXT5_9PROT|nr:DUF1611 domain-containing protein [Eilatimonas milleporae]RMB08753.1 putative NAD-dependent epimerase/dehydratase family protein [Eilatimonas milleporae]
MDSQNRAAPVKKIDITPPYLIFVGDETDPSYAKTGLGLVHWRRGHCRGQLRLKPGAVDLGLPDMTVAQARAAGIRSLVVGTAAVGGRVPDAWTGTLIAAARAGLDIVAGLHTRLADMAGLGDAARTSGARLVDIRVPPDALPVGTGRKRSGRRLLTVGTDCALGKKYTALQLARDMTAAGMNADFRATGQTGIMIAGEGIPIDAVVADFVSGAAECLSPDNSPDHWDVIEGQGALFHPGYGAVSHGLLVGSQPDAIVLCHAAGRSHISGWPDFPLPGVAEAIARTVDIGRLTNPDIRCVGISVNTSGLPAAERAGYLAALGDAHGLPCVDPLATGTGPILERLRREFGP